MADRRVRYVLEVDYEGQAAVVKAADDLREVDDAAKQAGEGLEKTGGGFERIAAGAAVLGGAMFAAQEGLEKVQAAAQFAYDTLQEGSALADARGDFEDLAAGIGSTADVMENRMGDAAAGLMTDAELIGQASELMSLNLGLTEEEIVRLSGLAAELDMDWQTLVDTLNTGSTRGLKTLGLNIDEVKGKVADLEAAGRSADEAFVWAIIESAEEKVDRVGKKSGEASGQIQILEKQVQGVQEAFALGAAEGFAGALGDIAAAAPLAGAGMEEMARSGASFITGLLMPAAKEFEESPFFQYLFGLGFSLGSQQVVQMEREAYQAALSGDAWQNYYEQVAAGADAQDDVAEGASRVAVQGEMAAVATAEYAANMEWAGRAAVWMGDAQERAAVADYARATGMEDLAARQEMANAAAEAWAAYTEEATARGGDYFSQITSTGEAQWDFAEAIYAGADAMGAGMGVLGDIGTQYDLFDESTANAATAFAQQQAIIDSLAGAAASGQISWENYAAAVEHAVEVLNGAALVDLGPREAPAMEDRGFREGFQEQLQQVAREMEPIPLEVELQNEAIETAVNEARGIVEGFVSPEQAYEAVMTMDISNVESGAGRVIALLDQIPTERTVHYSFQATGIDSIVEQLRAVGALP